MNILILAAMDKEISLLINLLNEVSEKQTDGFKIWCGTIGNHNLSIAKCGIGKVNSALNTLRLIQLLKPSLVINSGVAGGAGIPVGAVLVADRIAYHDVWCGPGTLYGQADGFPLFMLPDEKILELTHSLQVERGLICSGDKFISSPEELKFIRSHFPDVKAVDMESASIAQTCITCGVNFAVIRVVSDTPGEGENLAQYKDFWTKAPEKTFNVLKTILESLK